MVTIHINGRTVQVAPDPDTPLLWVLRDELGLTGTKYGCGVAQCGACTVHLDGQAVRSCVTPVTAAEGRGSPPSKACRARSRRPSRRRGTGWTSCSAGTASPARSCRRWHCSRRSPRPTDADIDAAMTGNLCRCATYVRIRAAIHEAAKTL